VIIKLRGAKEKDEIKSLMRIIASEWERARITSNYLGMDIRLNSSLSNEERDVLLDKIELDANKNPLKYPEKISKIVPELEEKLKFLHEVIGANPAIDAMK